MSLILKLPMKGVLEGLALFIKDIWDALKPWSVAYADGGSFSKLRVHMPSDEEIMKERAFWDKICSSYPKLGYKNVDERQRYYS